LPDAAISELLSGNCHVPAGLAMTGFAPVALTVDLSLRGGLLPDAAISALLSGDCHAPAGLAMTSPAPVALIVDLSLRS